MYFFHFELFIDNHSLRVKDGAEGALGDPGEVYTCMCRSVGYGEDAEGCCRVGLLLETIVMVPYGMDSDHSSCADQTG